MNSRVQQLVDRLDALRPKERALLTVAMLMVIVMLFMQFVSDPLTQEARMLQGRISTGETQIAESQRLQQEIIAASKRDPNVPVQQQLRKIATQLAEFENDIKQRAGELIPPQQMAVILKSVLERTKGLEFSALEGLGVEPLIDKNGNGEASTANAYRHGFKVSFKGSYLDTIAYLRALEQLPWRFFWDAVELNVDTYPEAEVSVVVYTLSLDRRWIGV